MNEEYDSVLSDLKGKGVFGSAVISRDGMIISSDLPAGVHEETFSIMCATIIGAANTANSELDRRSPNKIIVDSDEGRIIIANAGSKLILSVVVDSTHILSELFDHIKVATDRIQTMS
ncbi:MAG: roadblock/LC7 domain-containing protein [Thermoplasmata archaeon]